MKRLISLYSILIVGFCVVVLVSPTARAEELEFPTTEAEIIKVLSAEPPVSETWGKGRGGLKSTNNDSSLWLFDISRDRR